MHPEEEEEEEVSIQTKYEEPKLTWMSFFKKMLGYLSFGKKKSYHENEHSSQLNDASTEQKETPEQKKTILEKVKNRASKFAEKTFIKFKGSAKIGAAVASAMFHPYVSIACAGYAAAGVASVAIGGLQAGVGLMIGNQNMRKNGVSKIKAGGRMAIVGGITAFVPFALPICLGADGAYNALTGKNTPVNLFTIAKENNRLFFSNAAKENRIQTSGSVEQQTHSIKSQKSTSQEHSTAKKTFIGRMMSTTGNIVPSHTAVNPKNVKPGNYREF